MSTQPQPEKHPVIVELEKLVKTANLLMSIETELKAAHMLAGDVTTVIKTLQMVKPLLRPEAGKDVDAMLLQKIQTARAQMQPVLVRLHQQIGRVLLSYESETPTSTSTCTCRDWSDSSERAKCPAHAKDTGEVQEPKGSAS